MVKPVVDVQPELFVASGDLIQARDFSNEEAVAVPVIERDIHLIGVASAFAKMNIIEGMVKASHGPGRKTLEERYGKGVDSVVLRAQSKHGALLGAAREEFDLAFGYALVEAAGDKAVLRKSASSYSDFSHQFKKDKDARDTFIGRMRDNVRLLQDAETAKNRQEGLRPHSANNEDQKLSSRQRLEAILQDPRAGFLPATNREKTTVISFLDYLDNPQFPMGANNQLFEVHRRRSKEGMGEIHGVEAMRSIAYELTDYLHNSAEQLQALRDLRALVADCPNPAVTLAEEIGQKHAGYAPLARFLDLTELATKGQVTGLGLMDPLLTVEDRRPHDEPHKNKTVEDSYTAKAPEPQYKERVEAVAVEVTIGSARGLLQAAITDQQKRFEFMRARLEETELTGKKRQFTEVRRVARQALKGLDV